MADMEGKKQDRPRPLDGIRIVEYGIFHAGPGGSAILGDMGADVVKIESGAGDPERHWLRAGDTDMSLPNGESIYFELSNRNKKGIWLDIDTDEGREILHRLVKGADVFLTNLRSTTKPKMGLDYASLSQVNPKIIHANVSGYGPEGPMNDLGAFDSLGQAYAGMMYVTGTQDPALLSIGLLDQATSIAISHAILSALVFRDRHGAGQEVHVSLYGTALWLMVGNLMVNNVLSIEPIGPGGGDRSKHSPLRNRFRCQDGEWIMGTNHPEPKYWPILCEATGLTDLIDDPRFAGQAGRKANSAELVAIFDKVFAEKPRDEWMEIFLGRGLMFSSVKHSSEIKDDPQALANDYMAEFDFPGVGRVMVPGYPVRFSHCRTNAWGAAPKIGEHTDTIMRETGYTGEEIQRLKDKGIIK